MIRTPDPTTVAKLRQIREQTGLSWRLLAMRLGYEAQPWASRLSAVARNKEGCISYELENDLRLRIGLPYLDHPKLAVVPTCPTCGDVHGAGFDCHGRPVSIQRRRPPRPPDSLLDKMVNNILAHQPPRYPPFPQSRQWWQRKTRRLQSPPRG